MITKSEALLWSIALPGFAQFLNKQVFKGTILILLEIGINVFSRFNLAIIYSFQGNIRAAIEVTDYQWLMFYPCLYMFAMWDAYKYAEGKSTKHDFLPFVVGAYFITIGLVYSSSFKIANILIGPVWLPMLTLIPGLLLGFIIKKIIIMIKK